MSQRLIIQLARLGDLLQTAPVLTSLQQSYPDETFDLLCAKPLVSVGSFFPGVRHIFPWDGDEWGRMANSWSHKGENALSQALACLQRSQSSTYSMAYNLNNHSRAVLAAHLLASEVIGAGCDGPLSHTRPNWVNYLTLVGTHRGKNRVHLADAFCGMCGVRPPSIIPSLTLNEMDLPAGFSSFISSNGIRVALVIGSGDVDRRIPLQMWEEWIRTFLTACPEGRVILIGGTGERELTHTLLDRMPSLSMSRIWDACGQTSLTQLATILSQCTWVVGSDTGPLHLGVACGAKVQGFYFSRARVHETGPYGHGHWVWQAETSNQYEIGGIEGVVAGEGTDGQNGNMSIKPEQWPIKESVELLLTETCSSVIPEGWSLWSSHADDWGAYFIQYADSNREGIGEREQIWKTLHDKNVDWEAVREHMSMPTYSHVTEQTI